MLPPLARGALAMTVALTVIYGILFHKITYLIITLVIGSVFHSPEEVLAVHAEDLLTRGNVPQNLHASAVATDRHKLKQCN